MLISFLNPWSGIHAKGMRTEQDMPSFDLEWLHTTLLGFRIWYGKCSPVSSSSTSPHGLICSFAPTPRCKPFSRGVADGRISLYRGPPDVIQTRVGEHCVEFNSVNIVQTIQDWWGDVQRYIKKKSDFVQFFPCRWHRWLVSSFESSVLRRHVGMFSA